MNAHQTISLAIILALPLGLAWVALMLGLCLIISRLMTRLFGWQWFEPRENWPLIAGGALLFIAIIVGVAGMFV